MTFLAEYLQSARSEAGNPRDASLRQGVRGSRPNPVMDSIPCPLFASRLSKPLSVQTAWPWHNSRFSLNPVRQSVAIMARFAPSPFIPNGKTRHKSH